MSFLIPFLEMRETSSNLEKVTNVEEEEEESLDPEDTLDSEEVSHTQEHEGGENKTPTRVTPVKMRKHQNPAQEMVQIMKRNAEMRIKRHENDIKHDEVDMFYLSMAKTVKRLPQLEQANIRMALCQLVSEAEIRGLQGIPERSTSSSSMSTFTSSSAPSPNVDQRSYTEQLFWGHEPIP
ncbi:uncharacterized protein LOC116163316 [Photinus pyralis]|uniref:uncharacterized protein LOC116163316 n=1 Tax=Photinus pyralis TaxID=7054 RepID=UPI0012673238|nr:uncharacterized protein LOC116163316 [Photinus pyralis]